MPMPEMGEEKEKFMERCIPMVLKDGTAADNDQAVAICMSKFEKGPEEKSLKAGARHNRTDKQALQDIHDAATTLGAACPPSPSEIVTFAPLGNYDGKAAPNALKAISQTEEELIVGNYIVLWGDENHRDLEGIGTKLINADGSRGQFFTPNTKFESSYTKSGTLYVDWEHRRDYEELGTDEDDILGHADWKSAKPDEKGLFITRVLNRRKQYVQYIEELIKAGIVNSSSESTAKGVKINPNGEIIKWPLKRDTLTVGPMEPRMLSESVVTALKALKIVIPPDVGVINESKPDTLADKSIKEYDMEFTQEQLDTFAEAAGKAGAAAAIKSLPTINASGVQVTHDEADTPFGNFGLQLGAVKQATLTQGRECAPRLKALNVKATGMGELIGSEGGFLLEPSFAAELLKPLHDAGPFSSRCAKLPIGPNSNGVTVRAVDETSRATGSRWGGIKGYRLAEAGTKLPTFPTFKLIELRLKKYAVLCYATDELLQDTTALASIIQQGASEELDFMINDDILNGAGVAGPLGILVSPALVTVAKEAGQLAATVATENIFKMWARLHPRSKSNSVWFINTDITPQLYALKLTVGTGGMPMYMAPGSLPNSPSGALLGRPVVETEFSATLGTPGDILLADMSQYAMIDRDVQAATSIHVQFVTDEVAFRFVYRCDGQPKLSSPLTPYKGGSNTLSPFVALAVRA